MPTGATYRATNSNNQTHFVFKILVITSSAPFYSAVSLPSILFSLQSQSPRLVATISSLSYKSVKCYYSETCWLENDSFCLVA